MTTQLEDVSSNVAQDHISNQRLRNEAIRKGMGSQWQPSSNVSTNTSPTWYDTSTNYEGGNSTLASTYSKLKNNFDNLTSNYNTNASEGVTNFGSNTKAPSWVNGAFDTGLKVAGFGPYAGLGSAAFSLSQGNKPAAVGTLTSTLTNLATKGKIPGLPGVIGNLAGGIVADKPIEDIGIGIGNSLLGTVISKVNPYAGLAYGISRLFGVDPIGKLYDAITGTTHDSRYAAHDVERRREEATKFLDALHGAGWRDRIIHEQTSPDNNNEGDGTTRSASESGAAYHKARDEETEGYDEDEDYDEDDDDGDE